MLSAWPAAAEAFERAITEDSDVALANIARARIHCFYQQGETARKAAVAARAKVAPTRHRARRAMSNRSSTQPAGSGTLSALIPAPHEKQAPQRGQASSSSGPAKRRLVLVDDLGREIDELPYLTAGLLPGASGMQVVEDASTLVTARPEGNPTETTRRQQLAVRHRQRCPRNKGTDDARGPVGAQLNAGGRLRTPNFRPLFSADPPAIPDQSAHIAVSVTKKPRVCRLWSRGMRRSSYRSLFSSRARQGPGLRPDIFHAQSDPLPLCARRLWPLSSNAGACRNAGQ